MHLCGATIAKRNSSSHRIRDSRVKSVCCPASSLPNPRDQTKATLPERVLHYMRCPAAEQVVEGGEPVAIPNQEGRLTTPSTVAFLKGGDVLIGEAARRYASLVRGERKRRPAVS